MTTNNRLANRIAAALLAASVVGCGIGMPTVALAANGVQDPVPNGRAYTTTDAKGTGAWDTNDGKVDLTYDTTNGLWTDSQGTKHLNGTYVVRIPKAISYTGMNVGNVSTSDDYDLTVEGVLTPGASVTVNAQTGQKLTGDNLLGEITETTSLKDTTAGGAAGAYSDTNFHTFTAAQASNMTGEKVTGTTVKDTIALSGTALSAGTYTGSVQYSAALK